MELVGGGIFEEHAVVAENVSFLHAEVVVVLQEVEDSKLPWAGVGAEQLRPCGELQDGGATRRKAASRASSLPQALQAFDDSMTARRCDVSSGGAIGEDAGTAMRRAAGHAGFFFFVLYNELCWQTSLSTRQRKPHLWWRTPSVVAVGVGTRQHRWPFMLAHECWRTPYSPAQIVFGLVAPTPLLCVPCETSRRQRLLPCPAASAPPARSREAPAAPPHPATSSAARGSDQPCVPPPLQCSCVRLPARRPSERRHQKPSSIAATPPGAACPGACAALV